MRKKIRTKENLSPELAALADSIGDFIRYFGFKSIHGRVWTLLFLSKKPLASVDLARRLKVSKTLLSFAIADLLKYRVIEEAGKGIKRTTYYRANPDVSGVILEVLRNRELVLMRKISGNFSAFQRSETRQKKASSVDRAKIQELGALIFAASMALDALLSSGLPLERWGEDLFSMGTMREKNRNSVGPKGLPIAELKGQIQEAGEE